MSPIRAGHSLLYFSLGPVQSFIASARTVRDLWTGSYLLSYLTRKAIEAVRPGSDGVKLITPYWDDAAATAPLKTPSIPNRFIAEVPTDRAAALVHAARSGCLDAWGRLSCEVRDRLNRALSDLLPTNWTEVWDNQVGWKDGRIDPLCSPFEVICFAVSSDDVTANELYSLGIFGKDGEQPTSEDGLWSLGLNYIWRLAGVHKQQRHVPAYTPVPDDKGQYPGKCSLLGTYEQMGPAEFRDGRDFWEAFAKQTLDPKSAQEFFHGVTLRKRERLCAVSLVKRFAWPMKLKKECGVKDLGFADTALVAASEWLSRAQGDAKPGMDLGEVKNGHWLHWNSASQAEDEPPCPSGLFSKIAAARRQPDLGMPPVYYAVIAADGDNMGDLSQARPGEDYQQELSRALGVFAKSTKEIVEEKNSIHGTLVYAGGDDVLALTSTATALACVIELREKFEEVGHTLGMSPGKVTLSAGIAIVHYKEDLRYALEQARKAEKLAKNAGKDAAAITVCRRSGEHASMVLSWELLAAMQQWTDLFRSELAPSDRWVYRLLEHLPAWETIPESATDDAVYLSELKRELKRSEKATCKAFQGIETEWETYRNWRFEKKRWPEELKRTNINQTTTPISLLHQSFHDFLTAVKSAAFLARGRDA